MKKIIIMTLIVFSIFCLNSCKRKDEKSNLDYKLVLFSDGLGIAKNWKNKYGYFNEKFEIVIDFTYDIAEGFNDGLAQVKKDGYWFLINTKGEKVTDTFDYLFYDQINKLYIGSYKDDKNDVLLNEKGKVLCSYPYITKFSNNYAVVSLPDNKEGYINTKGKLVYSGEGTCSSFSWDYACIQDKNGDYWTIDSSFNKLHNFGKEYICVLSSLVECNNKYYDVFGDYIRDGKEFSSSGSKGYTEHYYYEGQSKIDFYCIENNKEIKGIKANKYLFTKDYLFIFDKNTLFVYNNYFEVIKQIEFEKDTNCYFGETDPYRKDVYIYIYPSNSSELINYKFSHKDTSIEQIDYLNDYSITRISKNYICIEKDNLYGYLTLDGEIVYEPCFNEIYIPTDDGYFVDPSTSKVYDKNMKQIIKDDTWKTIVLISSGSKY